MFAAQVLDEIAEDQANEPPDGEEHSLELDQQEYSPQDEEQDEAFDGEQYSPDNVEYIGEEPDDYQDDNIEADDDPDGEVHMHALRFSAISPQFEVGEKELRPFRTAVKVGSRPVTDPEDVTCLAAYIDINGVPAYTLFDSGSSADSISPDFVRAAHVNTFKLEQPLVLQLGCVGSKGKINYGSNVGYKVANTKGTHYFDVVNVDRYDAVVGIPFLRKHKVLLNFDRRQIEIDRKLIPTLTPSEESIIVAQRKVRKPLN
jgi:hypothetical protein